MTIFRKNYANSSFAFIKKESNLKSNSGARWADFTGGTIKIWVGTSTHAALTGAPTVTDLFVTGQTGGGVQRAVTRSACIVSITDTLPAHTLTMTCGEKNASVIKGN